jgi:hypothetical protein
MGTLGYNSYGSPSHSPLPLSMFGCKTNNINLHALEDTLDL